jgi:K+-sensing histidine kinase KdpD
MWIDARLIDLFDQAEWPIVSDENWAYPAIDVQAMGFGDSFALITVPIQARERFLGVLSVFVHRPYELTAYEKDLFVAIGQQAGMAMENMQLLEDAAQIQLLRELDRLRSELIANASHELRTPLGLIKIFVTALLMDEVEFSKEKRHEFLLGIEDETSKLEAIVDNLLDLGRMESGRLRLEKHPIDLANLIRRTALVMKPNMTAHELVIDLPEESLVANVDMQRIEQVLRNLISNAIKYSPRGGTIMVQGSQQGSQIQINVSDQGIGIAKEDQTKIFERFYRVENEITDRVRGAGLGLSICKWLVEAHNGQITVQSTPGEGSAFSVVLPTDA